MIRFRPGASFADFLTAEKVRTVRDAGSVQVPIQRMRAWLWLVVVVAMGTLVVRVASLQLLQGGRFRLLSEQNRVRRIKLPAPRGMIQDRFGLVLARNVPVTRQLDDQIAVPTWRREYESSAIAHVIGSLGEVSGVEVGLLHPGGDKYDLGDTTGRGGIEQQYEDRLKGRDGGRLVEVDNAGVVVRELGKQDPLPGQNLQLTLDLLLQETAASALSNRPGAVVASDPRSGEVLVLASSPGFDPNAIREKYAEKSTQADLPFLNRAIGAVYPPGSVFKMVTAAAALSSGKLKPSFIYTDTGVITVGRFAYTNWYFTGYGRTEGKIGWQRAIARSTDTFFYKVGEVVGPEVLAQWADRMGLGDKTGLDLPGEVPGLIPTPAWKEQAKGEKWFLGNTYHMAIGQGDVLTTPLQINLVTNVLAAGGQKCTPYLVKSDTAKCGKVEVTTEAVDIIKEGMVGACSSGGTAFVFFDWNGRPESFPTVACKTGTAEYVRPDGRIGTHAWLTAFAPADHPTISVTAMVEGGGEGSRVAAPIVRRVLAKYFGVADTFNYAAISGEGE